MLIQLFDSKESFDFSDSLVTEKFCSDTLHNYLCAYYANAHIGTKAQKTRAEVRGGGKKPWKQKGMGRARAGTITSPIFRKGGVTFAERPIHKRPLKVNKKQYAKVFKMVLSSVYNEGRLFIVDSFKLDSYKCKEFLNSLRAMFANFNSDTDSLLLILGDYDDNIYLASRNLHNITVNLANSVSTKDLLTSNFVVVTKSAAKIIENRFI